MLGSLYYSGRGVAQDYAKAINLFQKACDGRYMTGCAFLGRLYENGYGSTEIMLKRAYFIRRHAMPEL